MTISVELRTWAARHGVSETALVELADMLGAGSQPGGTQSEGRVQSEIRLAAPGAGFRLWRNNVGVLPNPDTGHPVRFGLANDSAPLNKRLKSSDLIGWRKRVITPELVGATIAQFATIECKAETWRWSGSEREQAQQAWLSLVVSEGGVGFFANSGRALDGGVN